MKPEIVLDYSPKYYPLVIRTAGGSQIIFTDKAAGLKRWGSDTAVGEAIQLFCEAVEVALDMPQFVEALKQRGAVVLRKGETMEETAK